MSYVCRVFFLRRGSKFYAFENDRRGPKIAIKQSEFPNAFLPKIKIKIYSKNINEFLQK